MYSRNDISRSDPRPTDAAAIKASRTQFRTNRLLWLGLAILAMGQLAISSSALRYIDGIPEKSFSFLHLGYWVSVLHGDLKVCVLFASLGYVLVLVGVREHLRGVRKWAARDLELAESERFARSTV